MMVCACGPSYDGSIGRRIAIDDRLCKNVRPDQKKITNAKKGLGTWVN
jgi:hypothetical protein